MHEIPFSFLQHTLRTLPGFVIACASLDSLGSIVQKHQDSNRPSASNRVVRAFDFEEQEINPLPVPLGWIRAQEDPGVPRVRPGFPLWNGAELDYQSPAFSGIGSVVLPTTGGSTSLVLRRGELPVFPDVDYLVSVQVRTQGLVHSKARITARLLDQFGNEMEGSSVRSQLVNTRGDWDQITMEIEGLYEQAAFLEVELQLLQPEQQNIEQGRKPFEVWEQDFTGKAFFDHLVIAQLPRLEITTGMPGNIIASESSPTLDLLVRDIAGDSTQAKISIYDTFGRIVAFQKINEGPGRIQREWNPELPGFGWYRAVLQVYSENKLVGNRMLEFLWISPQEQEIDSGMFSIHADLTDPIVTDSIESLITGAGVTQASFNLWNRETKIEDIQSDSKVLQSISEIIDDKVSVTLGFEEIPSELANQLALDSHQVLSVFSGQLNSWVQWVNNALDQFGQAVLHWEFGNYPTQERTEDLSGHLEDIAKSLSGFVPGPITVVPWALDRPIDQGVIQSKRKVLLKEEWIAPSEGIEQIVQEWAQMAQGRNSSEYKGSPELGIRLQTSYKPNNWSGTEISTSLETLARKAIGFWWQASRSDIPMEHYSLELESPWWVSPGRRGQVMPGPEMIVWNTLATHLGNRKGLKELNLINGVRALIVSPKLNTQSGSNSDGMIIMWLDQPKLGQVELSIPLSMSSVVQHDIFNNSKIVPLTTIEDSNIPVHQIEITRSPILITGVNGKLVEFLTSVQLSPELLIVEAGTHLHHLEFENPWPMQVRGKFYILEPGGYSIPNGQIDRLWDIKPRVISFAAAPFEKVRLPIDFAYSLGEIAGKREMLIELDIESDENYPVIRIQKNIELGLKDIELDVVSRRTQDGIVLITATVNNLRSEMHDFEIIAISPNEPRIRRSVNGVQSNDRVSREFAFSKVQPGDEIIITLLLRNSSARLNKRIIAH